MTTIDRGNVETKSWESTHEVEQANSDFVADNTLLSEREVRVMFGGNDKPVSHATIVKMRESGILETTYVGSNVRFAKEDVLKAREMLKQSTGRRRRQ